MLEAHRCSYHTYTDPVLISATIEASNFKFGTRLGSGEYLTKKQLLGPKLAAVWARGAAKIIWNPLFISATIEASNFKLAAHLFWEYLTKKQLLRPNLAGVWTRGVTKKFWDPLLISATVEARNFKFGT